MLDADNGNLLNGRILNGRTLNGNDLSGLIVGVAFSGVQLSSGWAVGNVQLQGTTFVGQACWTYSGTDFLGATFVGNMGDGSQIRLAIRGMSPGTGPNADLELYDIVYLDTATNTWQPACLDHDGNPVLAVPVWGRWDYRMGVPGGGSFIGDPQSFTFACVSGAIGKCVLAGYRPWASAGAVPLAPYLQACTRAIRADYCGNGISYTQTGTLIDLYDALRIQQNTETWPIEAQWREYGAACFRSHSRATVPVPCYNPADENTCGVFNPGISPGLIVTGIP